MKKRASNDFSMKTIWAPWRMEYILSPKDKGCFLCDIFKDKKDRKHLVLQRGKYCAVVMNRYPYSSCHLMVAPYRHIDSLSRMTPKEQAELMSLTSTTVEVLRRTIHPHGFNIGMNLGEIAGAGLKDHIHMHIVPRWSGDTNFMPILANVKIMPEALDEAWLKLRHGFERSTGSKKK